MTDDAQTRAFPIEAVGGKVIAGSDAHLEPEEARHLALAILAAADEADAQLGRSPLGVRIKAMLKAQDTDHG